MRNPRFALIFTAVWNMVRFTLVFVSITWLLPSNGMDYLSLLVLWFGTPGLVSAALALFTLARPDGTENSVQAIRLVLVIDSILTLALLIIRMLSHLDPELSYRLALNSESSIFSPDLVIMILSLIAHCVNIILLSRYLARKTERVQ